MITKKLSSNKSKSIHILVANYCLPQERLLKGMIQVLTVKNFFGYSLHGKEGHNNVEDTSSGY